MWLSLVERLVRDQEAAGSNPVTPTIELAEMLKENEHFGFFLLISGCVFGNLTGVNFAVGRKTVIFYPFSTQCALKNAKKIKNNAG